MSYTKDVKQTLEEIQEMKKTFPSNTTRLIFPFWKILSFTLIVLKAAGLSTLSWTVTLMPVWFPVTLLMAFVTLVVIGANQMEKIKREKDGKDSSAGKVGETKEEDVL